MKNLAVVIAVLALATAAYAEPVELGFSLNTEIVEGPTPDQPSCDGGMEAMQDDGTFENGYAWQYGGVVPPDYGSWAECYDNVFVCDIKYGFTQTGSYVGGPMDAYVWDDAGGIPGNVLCSVIGLDPGAPAFWPSISFHIVTVNCCPDGLHYVGFWGNWPGVGSQWYIASDEDGFGNGCPLTKFAPGIGYPTGWGPVTLVPTFSGCQDLGIREYYLDTCDGEPTATEEATWGSIKALY
jgi:hypothetical protein